MIPGSYKPGAATDEAWEKSDWLGVVAAIMVVSLVVTQYAKRSPPGARSSANVEKVNIAARSAEHAPAAYMQMVALVQSLALVFLFTTSALTMHLSGGATLGRPTPETLATNVELWLASMQAGVGFFLIVLTWHVNTQHMLAFKRVFGTFDSFIPFGFSVPEYFFITHSRPDAFEQWAFWITVFMGFAICAYIHLFRQVRREFFERNRAILRKLPAGYPCFIVVYIAGVGLIAMRGWLGSSDISDSDKLFVASLLCVAVFVFPFLHHWCFWHPIVRGDRGRPSTSLGGWFRDFLVCSKT